MSTWFDSAVFYHIYPLGLCGCKKENDGVAEYHFDVLKKWADHAKKMNFTAIYIGPLFESVGHGYETTDYKKVDCRLGTNNDFKEYVSYCHEIGLKVIVDGVFNHVGREFFAFKDVKENRENSRYCGWFCNLNFGGNNEYNDGFCYENWGGFNLLVKLNQQNQEVQNYLFDVIRFWVSEFDIDGIRLDAADVLDFGFMKAMRSVANEVKEDFWLMGEVIHGDYSRWVNDEMLHSVTNYELHKGIYSGHNDHNYFEIAHSIKRLNDICGNRRLYTFVDNHDVARIASKLNNKEHMSLVTILLYTVYGIPSVYYGSEFAIEGNKERGSDWNLRPALNLDDFSDYYENNKITKLCIKLGELKKRFIELTEGRYEQLYLTNRQFAFGRILNDSAMISVLNCDDNEAVINFNSPVAAINARDMLGVSSEIDYENGNVLVKLPANSGTVIYLSNSKEESITVEKEENDIIPNCAEKKTVKPHLQGMGIMVEDMKKMVDFYHDVLGFEIEYTENMTNVYLKKDNVLFLMYGRRNFEKLTSRGYQYCSDVCGHIEIALEVNNYAEVDVFFDEAVSKGAKVIFPPTTMQWGQRTCYIADPEGNLIEVGSFTE